MTRTAFIAGVLLFAAAAFVFVMEAFAALREWIALGIVMFMHAVTLFTFVRHYRDPSRYRFPILGAFIVTVLSCMFFWLFVEWLNR